MTIARGEVRAGLRDSDDRFAGSQLRGRQAEIEVALEIKRGHAGIFGIVEPELRPQAASGFSGNFCHVVSNCEFQRRIDDRRKSSSASSFARARLRWC